MNKKAAARSKKRKEKHKHEKCPYLSNSTRKICKKMVKEGLDGRVSSFDIEHFCMGNPLYCYYFRSQSSKK